MDICCFLPLILLLLLLGLVLSVGHPVKIQLTLLISDLLLGCHRKSFRSPPQPAPQHHRLLQLNAARGCDASPGHLTAASLPPDPSFPPDSPGAVMLQIGDEAVCFSAVFLPVLLVTRRASAASLLAAFLYVFVAMFRFPPVPPEQAARVLRPAAASGGAPVLANRGGSHDAPENTLAAIREVLQNDVFYKDETD